VDGTAPLRAPPSGSPAHRCPGQQPTLTWRRTWPAARRSWPDLRVGVWPVGPAAVLLDHGRRSGLELGDQGAGVAGAEPSRGGQLPSADRGTISAEFGVRALVLGALGRHLR